MQTPYLPEQIGSIETLQPANPAAGADFSITLAATPAAGVIYEILSIWFRFVTGAAVANRDVGVIVRTPAAVTYNAAFAPAAAPQVAALTRDYLFVENLPVAEIFIPNLRTLWRPAFWVLPGGILRSQIALIQAADQISSIGVNVRQWRVPV